MSASRKYDFSNFNRALKLDYVDYINNMTTCDNSNHFIDINKMFFFTFLPL